MKTNKQTKKKTNTQRRKQKNKEEHKQTKKKTNVASGQRCCATGLMEFITEVDSRSALLSSKPRPVAPGGLMGNEPWNIPVMETEDAVGLWKGVTMETHMEESRKVKLFIWFSHIHTDSLGVMDDYSCNLRPRPRLLLFLFYNYLSSLSFLRVSAFLHLFLSSVLSPL